MHEISQKKGSKKVAKYFIGSTWHKFVLKVGICTNHIYK